LQPPPTVPPFYQPTFVAPKVNPFVHVVDPTHDRSGPIRLSDLVRLMRQQSQTPQQQQHRQQQQQQPQPQQQQPQPQQQQPQPQQQQQPPPQQRQSRSRQPDSRRATSKSPARRTRSKRSFFDPRLILDSKLRPREGLKKPGRYAF